ncbi:metallophosphoesterase [Clostridium estertheticum]|uniref:metallophosphoesterase family protein n=1 Tax=Clostridium estertheticum TaxID=238834 RepID=UPI001C0DB806|nr:metallophosphoesterase [Clostridium estertheticum]MBU3215372.1 metallophosphoesterase [Clostridium estertheticum]WAG56998.1 metallophosphoesterase [Clostridium estertheticum]
MKIVILSDTHAKKHNDKLFKLIDNLFKEADMIIHAGDYISPSVVSKLKEHENFVGVWGNNDKRYIRGILNEKEILSIGGYRIGLYHGHGNSKNTLTTAYDKFINDKVDIIIFGHTHQPLILTKNKVLMINPGSPSCKRREPWYSYVVLEIENKKIDVHLKFFS